MLLQIEQTPKGKVCPSAGAFASCGNLIIFQEEIPMSNYYSNPTEAKAIGAVDRELQMMRARARRIKALKENGRLTAEELFHYQ